MARLTAIVEAGAEARAEKLPTHYADRELRDRLSRILRRRGFARTDTAKELAELARRSIGGDLSMGTASIRAEVCDRAARANATSATIEEARRFRASAAALDSLRDLYIADAVLLEAAGDADATLRKLRERTDPDTRSALFTALMRQRGSIAALNWARDEKLSASDFSPPGAVNLIGVAVQDGAFEQAREMTAALSAHYFDDCPALRMLRAQLTLAAILPEDRRSYLFQGLPLNPKELQLADGSAAEREIRRAAVDLRTLIGLVDALDLSFMKNFLTEFELWLRLEDSTTESEARAQLAREISEPDKTLERVRLAMSYDVPFNREALERSLQARKELGNWSPDERFAAFLIAYHSRDGTKISAFIEKYHDELFAQSDLSGTFLACIEIETLARLGRYTEARAHVALHRGKELTPEQASQLEDIITHIEAGDEIDVYKQRYETSHQMADLRALVSGLRARADANRLAVYAPILARATRTREDFGVAMRALYQAGRMGELVQLADDLPDLVTLDGEFGSVKGYALYQLGRVTEARSVARELMKRRGAANDRELAVVTAVETGDWAYIQGLLVQEIDRIDTLEARDLTRLARLALEVNSAYGDTFRDAALRKSPDDPQVNLAAYMLATERGEEYRGTQAHNWFEKAVRHSGADGPIRAVSMQDMVAHAAGWNEQAQKLDGMLRSAEIPLFIVGQQLRRQMIDLTLGLALRNADGSDSRLPYPLFAFAGTNHLPRFEKASRIALDITALITLDYLGLLGSTLSHFDAIIVAPSTLGELFAERQFIRVQQPSRIQQAKRIQELIAAGRLKIASPAADPSPAVSREIGGELASLLTEARRTRGLVVRNAPVPKLGSFLEEHVDMSAHSGELTDTRAVLAFLTNSGKIDTPTRTAAEAYLSYVDAGWADARSVTAQATLYLDSLAVNYLDHVGLLDTLPDAVSAVFVAPDVDDRSRETLQYERHANDLLAAIERIRAQVGAAIESGKIQLSARRIRQSDAVDNADDENAPLAAAPSLDLMSDLSGVDVIVVDDRCLNRFPSWTDGTGRQAAVATTLDLIASMHSAGLFDGNAYYGQRHKLRAAGYSMMPIETEELTHHILAAPIRGSVLVETPELAAVRVSFAMPLMHETFASLDEPWFNKIRLTVIRCIHAAWNSGDTYEQAQARGTWLLSVLPDPMAWCLAPENEAVWATTRKQTAFQLGYLISFFEGTREARRQFYAWLNDELLTPLEKAHPAIWADAFALLKDFMLRVGDS